MTDDQTRLFADPVTRSARATKTFALGGPVDEQLRRQGIIRDLAPNRVRVPDHPTSEAGAVSVSYRAGSQKARLLEAYRAAPGGLTDEEAAHRAGLPMRSCWWKRCNELREAKLIADTGATRIGEAGVPRMVCAVAP